MEEENKLIINMIEKSIEAFLLGIEIYNKPTIKYRAESFAYHICNAWELALKAYLIKKDGLNTIYYSNKTEKGTIKLSTAIGRIFTNKTDPIRKNLEEVIALRNTSTHFILTQYNQIYVQIFQSCAYNFYNFLSKTLKYDLTNKIDFDFILLITPKNNNNEYLHLDKNISDKYINTKMYLEQNIKNNNSESYSINIKYTLSTSNKIKVDSSSLNSVSVDNINAIYPYRQKEAYIEINKRIKELGISKNFRQHELSIFNNYFKLKENSNYYTVVNKGTKSPIWLCNDELIKFIVNEFKNNNNILDTIKKDSSE